jgi:hypothetical protein
MKYGFNQFCRPALFFCTLIVLLSVSAARASQPAPPTGPTAADMQSLAGRGEHFEVILKFPSLTIDSEVALTAYILDSATNEPVRGAAISGGMSSGTESITVPFSETDQPVAGAYQGKIRVVSDKPTSWLFDISFGEKSDLIAIDGFKVGVKSTSPPASPPGEARQTGYDITLAPAEIAILLALFALLQAAIFFIIRRRYTSRISGEDSR